MKLLSYTKSYLLLLFFVNTIQAQQTITSTLMHDGIERSYIVYIPESYDQNNPVPLVLNFHGYTSNAFQQMNYGDFRSISDREGFIIAHPNGTVDLVGNTHFNVGWGTSQVDDVGFTNALIDQLTLDYLINEERIYSTGMSNGGFISYELACQLSDRIAAIASVTGAMSLPTFENCNPQHPMPVLQIHGTDDGTVPYEGGVISKSIDEVMEYWVGINNCNTNPSITSIEDINMSDQSTVEHFVYTNGDRGVTTELFLVENGGHTWPGSIINFPVTNYDIDASEEIWKFFSRYDINGIIQTSSQKALEFEFNITTSPNPASDFIQICGENLTTSSIQLVLFDVNGAIHHLVDSNIYKCHKIDVSELSNGIYFLLIKDETTDNHITRKIIKI
ncbi:MAG: T9SS type A sorting domain-containing protein [Bacteroidia bacterium]|nr:T9SS type A sorting domain-containing protein [Bacteroidia bacterium]